MNQLMPAAQFSKKMIALMNAEAEQMLRGEGFAYRCWRLYFAPWNMFRYVLGCPHDEREKFFQEVWRSGKYRSKQ